MLSGEGGGEVQKKVTISDSSPDYLTLSNLNLSLSSSSTTRRELLSQFPTCSVEDELKWVKN